MPLAYTDKFCVDCVHCFERPRKVFGGFTAISHECQHPKALSRLLVDPVTGNKLMSRVSCEEERANRKDAVACGPEGYNWEAKK